jgi:effector-binding domain-containing protein
MCGKPHLCCTVIRAWCGHSGSFSRLGLAHAAVLDWIRENGYEPDGPPFELYATPSPSGFHSSHAVTTVFYPVRIKYGSAPMQAY